MSHHWSRRRQANRARTATHLILLLHDAPYCFDVEIMNLNRIVSAYFSLDTPHKQESSRYIIQSLMAATARSNCVPSNATLILTTLLAYSGDKITNASLRWTLEDAFTLICHFLDRAIYIQDMPIAIQNQSKALNRLTSEMCPNSLAAKLSGLSTVFRAMARMGKEGGGKTSLICLLDVFALNAWVSLVTATTCITFDNLIEIERIMSTQLTRLPSQILHEMLSLVIKIGNLPQPFDSVGLGFESFLEQAIISHAVSLNSHLPPLLTSVWSHCKMGCNKLLLILVKAHAKADCICDFLLAVGSPPLSAPTSNSSLQFNCITRSTARAIKTATETGPDSTRETLCKLRQLANVLSTVMNLTYIQCCDAMCAIAFERSDRRDNFTNSVFNIFNASESAPITLCGYHTLWRARGMTLEKLCWMTQSTERVWDTPSRIVLACKGANLEWSKKVSTRRIFEMAALSWLQCAPMHGGSKFSQLNTMAMRAYGSLYCSDKLHQSLASALVAGAMFDKPNCKICLDTCYQHRTFFSKKFSKMPSKHVVNVATE